MITNAEQEMMSQSSLAFERFGTDIKNLHLFDGEFEENIESKTSAVIRYQDRSNPF